MKNRVITFGEVMMRLAPPGYYRLGQTDTLGMTFGGAEANVSVSLANYVGQIDPDRIFSLQAHHHHLSQQV